LTGVASLYQFYGRSGEVTAIAHDAEELRELDAGARRAWQTYSERLRGLRNAEYERAEQESWAELQGELRRLERRRQSLNSTPT
jgi:rubrerythrin